VSLVTKNKYMMRDSFHARALLLLAPLPLALPTHLAA